MDNGADAAAYFAGLSRELLDDPEESATLREIVERAVDAVPACDWSGISLRRRRGRVEPIAASSPLADPLDAWQDELGEGPGLAAIETNESQLVDDVRNDARWPGWAARAAEAGVGSGFSIPLSTESHALGALEPVRREAVRLRRRQRRAGADLRRPRHHRVRARPGWSAGCRPPCRAGT